MFSMIKNLFKKKEEVDFPNLLERQALIIDVRSPQEFKGGHATGAVNIPLGDIHKHVLKLKQKNKPIITCCRSGARSGSAATTLKNAGLEVYNGGSWNQVQRALEH